MKNIQDFGPELARRMAEANMRQLGLAQVAGLSAVAICQYINGVYAPSEQALCKLDSVLPGLWDEWHEAIVAYAREKEAKRKAAQRKAAEQRQQEKRAAAADKPKGKKSRYGPYGSLDEVARQARDDGLTYGQYVAKYSVAAPPQRL